MKYQIVLTFLTLAIGAECASIVSTAGNNPSENVNIGQALNMYYQAFKKVMPCGYPPMGLPVLAPFTIDHWDFNYATQHFNLKGNLSNTVITGLNNFRLLGGSYITTTQRLTYDVVFDQVQILGEYEYDLSADVIGYNVKSAGKGLLNDKFIDFRYLGEMTFAPSLYNASTLRVSDFKLNFYFGDITTNNWNNLWDISVNNFANKWWRAFALMWSEQIQSSVSQLFEEKFLPFFNSYLSMVTMSQFVDTYVQQAEAFNLADCNLA